MKFAIFDLDGTLFDSQDGIINAFVYPLKELRIKYDENKVRGMIGHTLLEMYGELLPASLNDEVGWCIDEYRKVYAEQFHFGSSLYEGVIDVLDKLKNDAVSMAIATTKPSGITRKITEYFDIAGYFDIIMGTEDNTPHKPDPTIIYNIKRKANFEDKHTIFVGDTYLDILAGKNAGIKTCAALYGYGDRTKLYGSHPDYSIKTIYEVINILEVL